MNGKLHVRAIYFCYFIRWYSDVIQELRLRGDGEPLELSCSMN